MLVTSVEEPPLIWKGLGRCRPLGTPAFPYTQRQFLPRHAVCQSSTTGFLCSGFWRGERSRTQYRSSRSHSRQPWGEKRPSGAGQGSNGNCNTPWRYSDREERQPHMDSWTIMFARLLDAWFRGEGLYKAVPLEIKHWPCSLWNKGKCHYKYTPLLFIAIIVKRLNTEPSSLVQATNAREGNASRSSRIGWVPLKALALLLMIRTRPKIPLSQQSWRGLR